MKELCRDEKGSSLVELVMIMGLMTLFSLAIYAMISVGSSKQAEIKDKKDAQTDARVALSFLNVKLRQNDEVGKILVQEIPGMEIQAIYIKGNEGEMDSWIYFMPEGEGGAIMEFLGDKGDSVDNSLASVIVKATGLDIEYDENKGIITNTIHYVYGGEAAKLKDTVALRSGVGAR